jgi:uncharacterized protein YciW
VNWSGTGNQLGAKVGLAYSDFLTIEQIGFGGYQWRAAVLWKQLAEFNEI